MHQNSHQSRAANEPSRSLKLHNRGKRTLLEHQSRHEIGIPTQISEGTIGLVGVDSYYGVSKIYNRIPRTMVASSCPIEVLGIF